MTQPTFVPIAEADQVRPARHLHVPGPWTTSRPAELTGPTLRRGAGIGTPGPDSGFALRLAHRFADEVKLGEGESAHDVLLGVALVAGRLLQTWGMWATDMTTLGRQIGQSMTWLSVAALAVLNLAKVM